MAYRTKVYKVLNETFLEPIMKFTGLIFGYNVINELDYLTYLSEDKNKYIKDENGKCYVTINSEEDFAKYKLHKDELEYFNPFIKYKHTMFLLMQTLPVIYTKFCENDDSDETLGFDESEIFSLESDEIIKYIDLKQEITKDKKYKYILCARKKGNNENNSEDFIKSIEIVSEHENKIISMLILILKIISFIDCEPNIVMEFDNNYENLSDYLFNLLTSYARERELNKKDIKKNSMKSKELDDQLYILEEDKKEEEAFEDNISNENLIKYVKETLPIVSKGSDDDFGDIVFV